MNIVRAWAPGNISLLFKVMPDPDPSKMGSLGAGFTVNEGATVTISQGAKFVVTYNGTPITLRPVDEVVKTMTRETLSVDITSPLPLGSGFGISGASALASAYAINKLFDLRKTDLELATIAHRAEVVSKTGLGDVGNQWKGGICVKFVSSALFQMERLPFAGTTVFVLSWGKIPTPSILSNTKLLTAIDLVADSVLADLKQKIHDPSFSFTDLLEISNTFTRKSGLLSLAPHASSAMRAIQTGGGHAAMIILGDAVVSDMPFEQSRKLTIEQKGVKLL